MDGPVPGSVPKKAPTPVPRRIGQKESFRSFTVLAGTLGWTASTCTANDTQLTGSRSYTALNFMR